MNKSKYNKPIKLVKNKAESTHLLNYFSNSSKWKIPEYQRRYSWSNKKNDILSIFWKDVIDLIHDKDKLIFMGTFTTIDNQKDKNFKTLVDGQQRTTTFLLLFKAFLDFINFDYEGEIKNENNFIQNIEEFIYFTEVGERIKRLKLTDIENTDKFEQIFSAAVSFKFSNLEKAKNDFMKKSLYHQNYYFFREQLFHLFSTNNIKIEDFYNIFIRIWVVIIKLNSDDDELLIFESINSKGTSLTAMDLIKNFLFIKLRDIKSKSESTIELNLNNFFTKEIFNFSIFKNTPLDKIEDELRKIIRKFIIYRLSFLKDKKIVLPKENDHQNLYKSFKTIVSNSYNNLRELNNLEKLIKDIKKAISIQSYLEDYSKLNHNNELSGIISLSYEEFVGSQFFPIILQLSDTLFNFKGDGIEILSPKDDFEKTIKYFEKLFIKRNVVGMGTRLLTRSINSINVSNLQEFKEEINSHKWMPTDEEVRENLSSMNFYKRGKRVAKRIFFRIEYNINFITNEKISLGHKDYFQLEHIMPQNLDNDNSEDAQEWRDSLINQKPNIPWYITHGEFLNKIGNITITLDNQKLSNKNFSKKKKLYKESALKLNRDLIDKNKWDGNAINERTNFLIEEFFKIWSDNN